MRERLPKFAISLPSVLEVDSDLAADDQGVVNLSGPTRSHDILKVWLKEHRALPEISSIRPFENGFVVLNAGERV